MADENDVKIAKYKAASAKWLAKGMGAIALGGCAYAWIITGHDIGEIMVIGAILAVMWGEHFIDRIWG